MAVDTRNRRASVLSIAQPFNPTLPLPDGVVGRADWYQVSYAYVLISVVPFTTDPPPPERIFAVPAEDRSFAVEAETRSFSVPAETRTFVIPVDE